MCIKEPAQCAGLRGKNRAGTVCLEDSAQSRPCWRCHLQCKPAAQPSFRVLKSSHECLLSLAAPVGSMCLSLTQQEKCHRRFLEITPQGVVCPAWAGNFSFFFL